MEQNCPVTRYIDRRGKPAGNDQRGVVLLANLKDRGKIFAWAAAACFAACFLADLFPSIDYIRTDEGLLAAVAVLELLGFAGLAVTVFLRNKKGVMLAACVQFAVNLLILLVNLGTDYFDLIHLFNMAAYALLAFAAIRSGREDGRIGWLWFLPGAFSIASLAAWACQPCFLHILWAFTDLDLDDWVYMVSYISALFLAGLWLKNDPSPVRISAS